MIAGNAASSRLWAVVLCGCAVGLAAGEARGGETASIYYQVTRTDGTILQANEVPRTDKGIREVLRVTRFEQADAGAIILSTGPQPVSEVSPGRTVIHKMEWNGRAWVAEVQAPTTQPAEPKAPPTPKEKTPAEIVAEEVRKTRAVLEVLGGRLKDLDHTVGEAERNLEKAKGTPTEQAAKDALDAARKSRQDCVRAVEQYQGVLNALAGGAAQAQGEIGQPAGKVQALDAKRQAPEPTGGVLKPVRTGCVPSHRVQVWKLPSGKGRRTYRLWMAHPEAGPLGAFYYVAYADTDGDGRPDRQIARSPLATADRPGQWTQWEFTTDSPAVYAGNAWTNPWTQVYGSAAAEREANWRGPGNEVYVAPFWGAGFRRGGGWGFLTNLRYRVVLAPQQLDEPPSPSTGSGIYVWEIR